MNTSTRSSIGFIVLAAVSVGCATSSNTREGRIAGERQGCRAAAALVADGQATAETYRTLAWCDETGPDALAAGWRRPLPDGARLDKFLFASGNIRDARIFGAAYAVASDSKRPPNERGAALLILVAQLDSSMTVGLVSPPKNERWRAWLARESQPLHVPGTKPLPADAHTRVSALARTLRADRSTAAAPPLIAAVRATERALQQRPRVSAQSRTQRDR